MKKSSKPQHASHWVRLLQEQVERARAEAESQAPAEPGQAPEPPQQRPPPP